VYWVEHHLKKQQIVGKSNGPLSEVQSGIIDSCLAREDYKAARQFISDWNETRAKESARVVDISKWIPGDHYYALSQKFSSLSEAESHVRKQGYIFSGVVRERFHYRESGG
jgi:hypothetical protein